ncbi:glycosyltransferase [Pseudomonas sp. GCM10022188]|uniref:glycosyltransferase n=1 Tax=Pseudomonas TaxID=286 RepID=UPI001E3F63EC|nr:glycosyltransferase [Pseudomonas oryzagri]MCC6076400.1 glycosyltransferase [Pseudomonas oryzagri]
MSVTNVVWSGGQAYASIHKVHGQILALIGGREKVRTWVLQGSGEGLGAAAGDIKEWGMATAQLKGRGLWRLCLPIVRSRLRRKLQEEAARVLLLDGIGVARLCVPLLNDLPDVRALVVFHGVTRLRPADIRLLRRFPADRLQLVAVSAALAASLHKQLERPVIALRTAIDPQQFQSALLDGAAARQALQAPAAESPLLGAVGRLVPEKGYATLLEALALLVGKGIRLHLVIVGEGEQRPVLEAKIRQLGLAGHVTLAGHRADVARLYRAFDLMLTPSRNEGLGLVVQEAVMAGVPVVCSDLPVFVEQIGAAGVYLAPDDVAGWAAAIERVLAEGGASLAARQYRELAPEQAWEAFCRGYRALLAADSIRT